MTTNSSNRARREPLRSLGALSRSDGQNAYEARREELRTLAGKLDRETRRRAGAYLRGGSIVFAIMEYTEDVIDGRFRVSGGSGINTDGVYFWRRDAANYVEEYGIELPAELLEHCAQHEWKAQELDREALLRADDELTARRAER